MNRRITTGILIAIAGLILAVLGIYAIRQILNQALAPLPMPTPPGPVTEQVVVVARDLAIGTLLAADDLRTVDMPVELMPRNTFKDKLEVIGRVTKVALIDGEMVLPHHVADPSNVSHDLAFIIEDDQVLMAFPAGDLMSDLNVLQRGDLVDILVSIEKATDLLELDQTQTGDTTSPAAPAEGEPVTRLFTFDAMQAVEISAIIADIQYEETRSLGPLGAEPETASADPANRQPSSITVKAYLLAISPQDALVLKHLKDLGGEFDIVLRSASPPLYFDLDPVIDEYIIDKYELEVIK